MLHALKLVLHFKKLKQLIINLVIPVVLMGNYCTQFVDPKKKIELVQDIIPEHDVCACVTVTQIYTGREYGI